MSAPARVKSINFTEPVVGSKARSVEFPKPKPEKSPSDKSPLPGKNAASILRQRQHNLSLNASCSSDTSTDSWQSRASTGRILARPIRKKHQQQYNNTNKFDKLEGNVTQTDGGIFMVDGLLLKKRCAWLTSTTDPLYVAFHDEEWGLPVHDDKKLFELLSFSTALAELTWPVILNKRHIFRDIFLDFDPVAVSKLNEKKIVPPGSPASTLLSELKLRAIIENARQVCKIIAEVGSFDRYIWGFVNNKSIVGNFRYPRQVPIKTSKADTISKDLVRRGFRGVGPTVIYSFMQATGITNDHLVNCFRYQECLVASDLRDKSGGVMIENEEKQPENLMGLELGGDIADLSLSR